MSLINTIKHNKNIRKLFGKRELIIIEKQLWGIRLKPSERTRLSRDIRKKFEAVRLLSAFVEHFKLKKGLYLKEIIENVKKEIFKHPLFPRVKRIILFGTAAENKLRLGSDIDIAVEFDKNVNEKEAFKFKANIAGEANDKVDIQIFNFLPEEIKNEISKNGKILFERKN